mmetsp:Transcript_32559/g.82297  ORF Transcript_32559/g.82297 Transcript_32559/m.82297 type:complete len:213 (-) Transcript_32559:750-1388(-)
MTIYTSPAQPRATPSRETNAAHVINHCRPVLRLLDEEDLDALPRLLIRPVFDGVPAADGDVTDEAPYAAADCPCAAADCAGTLEIAGSCDEASCKPLDAPGGRPSGCSTAFPISAASAASRACSVFGDTSPSVNEAMCRFVVADEPDVGQDPDIVDESAGDKSIKAAAIVDGVEGEPLMSGTWLLASTWLLECPPFDCFLSSFSEKRCWPHF